MVFNVKSFWEDLRWAEKNHTRLLERYKDTWVAISEKKVVSFGENLAKVEKEASQKTGRECPVVFVECGEHIYAQN